MQEIEEDIDVRTQSYWACRLSLDMLLRGEGQMGIDGIKPDHDASRRSTQRHCYLWTLTTPDIVDETELMRRWDNFARYLRQSKKMCVRVVEKGSKGTCRLHIHMVTPQYWRVKEVRRVAEARGFGRINAKSIPMEKAAYVAKYITKTIENGDTRCRRWAAVGFEGAAACNIRCKIRIDNSQLELTDSISSCDTFEWKLEGNGAITFRPDYPSQASRIHTMMLKNNQQVEVLKNILSGAATFVGEYRGYAVRTIKFEDRKTHQQIERVTVEHNVEVNGMAKKVVEWLPPGSDAKIAKAAAEKGDLVMVTISAAKKFGGEVSYEGTIKSLTQLV